MLKPLRIAMRAIAVVVIVVAAALAFHYHVRLRLLENRPLVVVPGKWVWVECQTMPFVATIEEVGINGVVLTETANLRAKLPCEEVGIIERGGNRLYFPFRAMLGLEIDGRRIWSNPYPM